MKISVIIPTANRPEMLREALKSVQNQKSIDSIQEIIVIENLLNKKSGDVCREFTGLPIKYIFRDNPIAPQDIKSPDLLENTSSNYIAILFDDDYWDECHIERAIIALSNDSSIVASYGSCIFTTGPDGYFSGVDFSFNQYFAASTKPQDFKWIFGMEEVIVASLLRTTFHYSSLVAKKEILFEAYNKVKEKSNPYDTDRALAVELVKYGKISIDTRVCAYIRNHENTERNRNHSSGLNQAWWDITSAQILETAEKYKINLAFEYKNRMLQKEICIRTLAEKSDCHGSVEKLISIGILEGENKFDNQEELDPKLNQEELDPKLNQEELDPKLNQEEIEPILLTKKIFLVYKSLTTPTFKFLLKIYLKLVPSSCYKDSRYD